jgi:hypothetical protein
MIAGASGDTATWVGSIGTCAVGILAAVIAWVQYNHSRFRPQVHAYHDLKGRVVVRVTNEGAGTGTVEDVDLLSGDPSSPALTYVWETTGSDNDKRTPIPFTLPGLSTAQLVMQPTKAKAVTPGHSRPRDVRQRPALPPHRDHQGGGNNLRHHHNPGSRPMIPLARSSKYGKFVTSTSAATPGHPPAGSRSTTAAHASWSGALRPWVRRPSRLPAGPQRRRPDPAAGRRTLRERVDRQEALTRVGYAATTS